MWNSTGSKWAVTISTGTLVKSRAIGLALASGEGSDTATSQWLNCHSSSEMASKTTGPIGSNDVNHVASTMAMFSTRTCPACCGETTTVKSVCGISTKCAVTMPASYTS